MSAELVVEIFRNMLSTAMTMVLPLLLTGMSVGLSISLFQSVTSIQEQTLSFVPKLVAVVGVIMALAFWLIEQIVTFTLDIFNRMGAVGN